MVLPNTSVLKDSQWLIRVIPCGQFITDDSRSLQACTIRTMHLLSCISIRLRICDFFKMCLPLTFWMFTQLNFRPCLFFIPVAHFLLWAASWRWPSRIHWIVFIKSPLNFHLMGCFIQHSCKNVIIKPNFFLTPQCLLPQYHTAVCATTSPQLSIHTTSSTQTTCSLEN